ncbi:hypothetical protein AGMMS50268_15480 [Spirochaetia bacterium]|nr:hypothetical protein AGMMS50268_15480 [Spirochaetia bacterium]
MRFGLKLSFLIALIAALAFAGCKNPTSSDPDTTAPAEVSGLTATSPGNGSVVLNWTDPTDSDFAKAVITYTPGTAPAVEAAKGTQTAAISGLVNGTAYTFTVKTVDTTGNTSAGTTATATPAPTVAEMNAADFGPGVTPTPLTISSPTDFSNAKTTIEATPGNYVLTITGTVDVGSVNIEPAANTVVSLRGGGTLHLSSGTDGLFKLDGAVGENRKLILRDAVLKGHAGASRSLVSVVISSAEFVMYGGTITGNTAAAGGGVYVDTGTFTMSGGTISGNTANHSSEGFGGGVAVMNSGTFTMSGGTISGNTANIAGGGVVVMPGSTFTKTGGTITGNTGSNPNTATNGFNGRYGHAVYVFVDGTTGDRYRNTDAGTGVNISITSDLGTAQGTAPWL